MKKTTQSGVLLIVSGCLALCGWGATTLSFAPEGAAWTGGEGVRQFEDTDNWTKNSSGTSDELLIQRKSVSLYLEDDVSLTKIKLSNGDATDVIAFNLNGHTLTSSESFKLWNQDAVLSNGTLTANSITMGESSKPRAHLTLEDMAVKLSNSSLSTAWPSNSLSFTNCDLSLGAANSSGLALSGAGSSIRIHNSAIVTNNASASGIFFSKEGCRVEVDGELTNFRSGKIQFQSNAEDSVLSVRDGVSYYSQDSHSMVEFADGSTSNLVSIGPMKAAFYRTQLNFNAGSTANRLVVEPDAVASFWGMNKVAMAGKANRIEVRSGTLTNTIFKAGLDTASSGNAVAISGDGATFTVVRDLVVGNKENTHAPMRFEFTPGEKGFNNAAPFRAVGGKNFTKAISNLVVAVDATAFVGEKTGKFKLPLMKFGSAPNRLEVDELNAVLESEPAGGTLSYDTTDKTLYWNYRKPRGLMLIFR